ncbi:MAG TPA: GtrA family protein [Kofleriaceae bacterium]|jgi:putative flippase GtrA|nr:GtrA family protein [Kofleriaceae bacterium]
MKRIASGLAGIGATAVDVCALTVQVHRGTPVALAAFIAAAVGACAGFALNKYVAFRDRSPVTLAQLSRFAIVALGTALLVAAGMELFAVHLRVPYLAAKALCSLCVFAAWTYPAQRRLVFAH